MPYIFVEDFKFGMDRRRPRWASVPGTIWTGENVILSRGGDIERAKRMSPQFTGLTDTFGLENVDGRLTVFGSKDLAATMPVGVQYQRLQAPSAANMIRVLDNKRFDNLPYVIAEYDDGSRYHFYNGARVTDWDTVAAADASAALTYAELAKLLETSGVVSVKSLDTGVLVTANTAGTDYTIAGAMTNGAGGVNDQTITITNKQANVAAVAETRATATLTVTGGTFSPGVNMVTGVYVGATSGSVVNLLGGPVNWVTDNTATANAVAVAINDRSAQTGFSAAASGADVVISAINGLGATANGYVAEATVAGNATMTASTTFAGGVSAVTAVARVDEITFGGTFEAADLIDVTLNGVSYKITGAAAATGKRVYIHANRVWSLAGPRVRYCALNAPTDWTTVSTPTVATDAGVIVLSTDSNGSQTVYGMGRFQNYTAIFSDLTILVYDLQQDQTKFAEVQELPNTGTPAGKSVLGYGARDVFYLDAKGVRSLQARYATNYATSEDVGTAFDPFVHDVVTAEGPSAVSESNAIIEPLTGSYWLAIGSTILVRTGYTAEGVTGWTYLKPGFVVTGLTRTATQVYVRSSDTIYLYGGTAGTEYPLAGETPAVVKLPFASAKDPAGLKELSGFDAGLQNVWTVNALVDPNDETLQEAFGVFEGVTYSKENADEIGVVTHLALEFTCAAAGFASISNLAIHHTGAPLRL